jgi:hypothetical protein
MVNFFLIPLEIVIPLGAVLVILVAIMWILYYKNKQLNWILISEKKRFAQYKRGVRNLSRSTFTAPEKDFEILIKFVRAFFKEYFQLDFSLTFSELEGYFKKKNEPLYAKLCKLISDKKYGGEKIAKDTRNLVILFQKIIMDYESKNQ